MSSFGICGAGIFPPYVGDLVLNVRFDEEGEVSVGGGKLQDWIPGELGRRCIWDF